MLIFLYERYKVELKFKYRDNTIFLFFLFNLS